jgi:hypothetical protein
VRIAGVSAIVQTPQVTGVDEVGVLSDETRRGIGPVDVRGQRPWVLTEIPGQVGVRGLPAK